MKRLLPFFVFLIFMSSCEENNPQDSTITLNETSVEVDYNKTFQLEATFKRDGYVPGEFEWATEKTRIATVSPMGLITAKKVGETKIKVTTKDRAFMAEATVKVLPTNFLYTEPVFGFRGNKTFIKNNEKRTLDEEEDDSLTFLGGNSNENLVLYLFEDGILNTCGVLLKLNQNVVDGFVDYLEQRYDALGVEDETFIFENEQVLVGVQVESYGVVVAYLRNPSAPNTRIMKKDLLIDALEKIKGA